MRLSWVRKLLKERVASPLVEEGILLSLTVVSLAVVLSLIVSIFGGIDKMLGGTSNTINSFFENAARSLDDLLRQLSEFIAG